MSSFEFMWLLLSFQRFEVSFLFILNFDSFNTNFFLTFFNSVQGDIFRSKIEFHEKFTVVSGISPFCLYVNGRLLYVSLLELEINAILNLMLKIKKNLKVKL